MDDRDHRPLLWPRPAWQAFALCKGMDPALFYPERGDQLSIRHARALCAACPVRQPCLDVGIGEKFGMWGGVTERERRRLRAERAA